MLPLSQTAIEVNKCSSYQENELVVFILALMVEKTKFRFRKFFVQKKKRFRKFLGNFVNSKIFNIWIKYIYIYMDYKKE